MTFAEQPRELPVFYNGYDIVVCGGGIAGIAASLAASRSGKHVLLLENLYMLGGLATAGLITIYLPLCDGKGHQVIYGIAEELLQLSISQGWERDYPSSWIERKADHGGERYEVRFNASVFAILVEGLLKSSGVDILYGTRICSVIREDDRIKAVVV